MRIKLRYKLFLVILLSNALMTTAIVIANNRAFSTGFSTYLNEVQMRRLTPLLEDLAETYAEQGGWQWIRQYPDRWQGYFDRNFRDRRPQGERPSNPGPDRPGPPPLALKDADGNPILGNGRGNGPMIWLPIEWEDRVVGELGVPQSLRLTAQFDRLFAEQQRRQLRWIALASLGLSAIIAIPFASRLLRPIGRLKDATHRLTSGDYEVRLSTDGGDELADLAQDFNTLADTLSQNLNARQRWIADISHELRTPIAVIRAELEALQDGIRQPDSDTLQSLHQEIERLGGLVEDLHELSLSDAGALSYRKEAVDLVDVISEVGSHFQQTLELGHYRFQMHPDDRPVVIQGDANRLMQLFTNLMQNSLNYTDSSADAPGTVRIDMTQDEHITRVLWSDSAPGVPESSLPRLFERLYRVEESRNRATGGSGLGLAIVHNVVEAHQGRIEAKPSPLGGLTLEITFPTGRTE